MGGDDVLREGGGLEVVLRLERAREALNISFVERAVEMEPASGDVGGEVGLTLEPDINDAGLTLELDLGDFGLVVAGFGERGGSDEAVDVDRTASLREVTT